MEPIVDKITLVEDARFDSPKSMFLGRVMGKYVIYYLLINKYSDLFTFSSIEPTCRQFDVLS